MGGPLKLVYELLHLVLAFGLKIGCILLDRCTVFSINWSVRRSREGFNRCATFFWIWEELLVCFSPSVTVLRRLARLVHLLVLRGWLLQGLGILWARASLENWDLLHGASAVIGVSLLFLIASGKDSPMQLILLVNTLMHHSKVLLLHRLRYVCFIARVPLVLARAYLVTGSISRSISGEVNYFDEEL